MDLDPSFRAFVTSKREYSRDSLKSSKQVFKLIKKAGVSKFAQDHKRNGVDLKFKETFTILTELRHAITHSKGVLETEKITKTKFHRDVFGRIFPFNALDGERVHLTFDLKGVDRLLIFLAEFGFQIYKALSLADGFEWEFPK